MSDACTRFVLKLKGLQKLHHSLRSFEMQIDASISIHLFHGGTVVVTVGAYLFILTGSWLCRIVTPGAAAVHHVCSFRPLRYVMHGLFSLKTKTDVVWAQKRPLSPFCILLRGCPPPSSSLHHHLIHAPWTRSPPPSHSPVLQILRQMGEFDRASAVGGQALALVQTGPTGPHSAESAVCVASLAGLAAQQGKPTLSEELYRYAAVNRHQFLCAIGSKRTVAAMYSVAFRNPRSVEVDAHILETHRNMNVRPQHSRMNLKPHTLFFTLSLTVSRCVTTTTLAARCPLPSPPPPPHPQRRSLGVALRVFGSRHPAVAAETNVLAVFLVEHGRNREAEACYRQSMEIWERTLGPYSPELASGLNNLAILLFMEDRPGYV